ncbi:hypothetical protein TWF694_007328 [Orbilia ellipsospora]|uniref:Uncharacterized protein n=1 Tax=Orbilia ellipsospora TaxID=2528407 RepID=A0AAV9XJ18_9PEZI
MKFTTAIIGALSIAATNAAAIAKPTQEIHVQYYDYDGLWLNGQAKLNPKGLDCGRSLPKFEAFWSQGSTWQSVELQRKEAAWQEFNAPFAFRTYAENATQLYFKYTCGAQEFYEPAQGQYLDVKVESWN